ncbi:MAG: glycosyltransferase family 1 protein [Chloroflexi bacterium]|nr:glycosyltransferase family 1 protein [Chloroflexota bacterium]
MLYRPSLPARINRLDELINNLWWSWHPQARDLFRALDYPLWRLSGHNPVKQLRDINAEKLKAAASDPSFLTLYDSVMAAFDSNMSTRDTWFENNHPGLLSAPVGYFSMEFAIHNSLPIYAGGLGILAGDICKEASDLGLPLVGVGFMYPQGYFIQRISPEGWQEEIYKHLDFSEAPINPVPSSEGRKPFVTIQLNDRSVHIGAWKVRVGRVDIYLLDTNFEENTAQDRQLSARLYIADRELRIQQEIVLGIGGVRVLRALGINPVIWHANEGHTAFMMLERVREEVEKGATFDEAVEKVRATTVFTTHTPVPAGHDTFSMELAERYFHRYWGQLGIGRDEFLELGQETNNSGDAFNMTVLALALAEHCNAVSKLHGEVTRKMWHVLWPESREEEVPISYITNGVHVPTWIAPEMGRIYEKYLGQDWVKRHDDPELWDRVMDIPDKEIWDVRQLLKRKRKAAILDRAQKSWADGNVTAPQVLTMGALLDPDVLTIGFVRRFAEYKRPALIFRDLERLKRIVNDRWQPVQIIFAGKSHPADFPSKYLLHQVYTLAADRALQGRIAFVEDYDMHMARYLVHGVDIWLNNPRRLREASGTSGMKAALNGIPHLSVLDGWWYEGYNGSNGWSIGDGPRTYDPEEEDRADAEALYRLLEDRVVPLYYDRDRDGIPHNWIHVVKETIRSVVPQFCARRMLKEYTDRIYTKAAQASNKTG